MIVANVEAHLLPSGSKGHRQVEGARVVSLREDDGRVPVEVPFPKPFCRYAESGEFLQDLEAAKADAGDARVMIGGEPGGADLVIHVNPSWAEPIPPFARSDERAREANPEGAGASRHEESPSASTPGCRRKPSPWRPQAVSDFEESCW